MHTFSVRRVAVPLCLFAGLLGLVFGGFAFLLQTETFQQQPTLFSAAMLIDLLIALPAAFWLAFRKSGLPPICVAPIGLLGYVFASNMLPDDQQRLVSFAQTWFIPTLELFVAAYIVVALRRAAKSFHMNESFDHRKRISASVAQTLGKHRIAEMVATEFTMFYYCFRLPDRWVNSEHRLEAPEQSLSFSYHQKSGMATLLLGFLFAVLVELAACHFLLAKISHLAAWIATLSSVYIVIMIVGQARALKWRPIYIKDDQLTVRNGMFELCSIPIDLIKSAEQSRESISKDSWDIADEDTGRKFAPIQASFPGNHNLIIRLKKKWSAELLYGKKRDFKTILLGLDKPNDFLNAIGHTRTQPENEPT